MPLRKRESNNYMARTARTDLPTPTLSLPGQVGEKGDCVDFLLGQRPWQRGSFAPVQAETRKPVRVCFLIDRLDSAGTESQLVALIRNLDRERVQPFLCLLRGEDNLSRSLEPDNCPVLRLGVGSLRHPSTLAKAWRFARFLRRQRVDVVQTYFPESTYFGVIVARLAGVPRVVRTRNSLGYWMTPTHRIFGRFCNLFTDVLLANCDACRQAVIADEGVASDRIVVLENGVDLARFPWPSTTPRSARSFGRQRVGVVANLRPVKDLDLFARAAAEVAASHPDAVFQIAGEGELRPTLEHLASTLGLGKRFSLPGSITDVSAFLRDLDVAVLCSRSEGMSNALLEYMAAGKAIVATAVGANTRLIEHGIHGLLVPPGDSRALAAAIGRLLSDPGLAAQLGATARRRVEDQYSREMMVRRFEDFYLDLMAGSKGRRGRVRLFLGAANGPCTHS
jgi:glycosyltransferase involved in cell wall biosynthesis